jgi:hypothetical protein
MKRWYGLRKTPRQRLTLCSRAGSHPKTRRNVWLELERLEEKQLLSLSGPEVALLRGASVAAHLATFPTNDRVAAAARAVNLSKPQITNLKVYQVNGVEGHAFNHVLVATFAVKNEGTKAIQFVARDRDPRVLDKYLPQYIENESFVVKSRGKGLYDVYVSGTFAAVPPVTTFGNIQLPDWDSIQVLTVTASPAISFHSDFIFQIADVPLVAVGDPMKIDAPAGVDTGMVNLAAFADQNHLVNFANTKYQVTIDWGDTQPKTKFIGKQQMSVGYVSGSPEDWEIYSHHMYTKPGTYPIVIEIVDDPPAVGGAGKQSIALHAQAVVSSSVTLQMNNPAFVVVGKPLPPPPDAVGIAGYLGNIPSGVKISAYKITVNWGDGTPATTSPTLYNVRNAGFFYGIVDNHPYTQGGPEGNPDNYTITITVTGPGIDQSKPLKGTQVVHVFQG